MLHTLLPPVERKALRFEYRLRALTVLLFCLSVAGVVGIGSLFPAFVKALSEQASAARQLDAIKKAKDQSGLTAIQQQVAIGQKLLTVLSQDSAPLPLSAITENIVRERGQISITALSVSYTGTSTAAVAVQGNAPTRDELLAFKSRLENDVPGSTVSLPVSELAKGTNIAFSIQVKLSLK